VIPPQKREEVALFLIKEKDSSQNILARVFQAHPEWKELSRLHLQAILEEEISSKEMMIQWANFIVHSQSLFGVDEETPLFQKVMSILLALESSMQSSPKNPYVLYQRLLDTHKKEALWTGPFKGPMRLSLARLQHRDPKVPFIKKDLPKEIPLQGFKPLVASLQERLEENEELKEKIQTLYGASLNELQANLLHGDLIVHLLQLPIEEADSIQEMTFYLYNILSYLWQLDGSYSAQELFSPQEEELLQFASMLNCCETGQKEAIVFYYNHLPMKNRVGPLAKTSCQEKRALFVENAVDASLHKVFAEEGFLRSLAKKEKVQEQIHQTLYLKNRLTKQVGLLMPVCFDLYAEMIDNEIVRAPLATLMTTFFQFFTEGKLVKQLQEDFLGAREFCLPVREIFELVCYEQAQEALRESSFKEDLAFLQKQADYVLQTHLAKDWEIPPSLQERYKEVSLQKKQLDQLVKEHLLSLVVEEQDAFVKDLQELPVTDFSLSVQELLDILEKERGAYLCKQWLASLQDLPKEVSLQEHLDHHLVEEPLRSYLALLDAKRSLGYYQRLLASKRIHAPAAFVLLDRLSQLQDRGQSVQELLYALSQHSMHLSLSSYLQSASGLSPELKEHLGFYQRQEDLPVFQLMRMLEKKETQSNEAYRRDLFAFLEDRSALMKKWLLENQLTEEGALFLLKEQGYVV